MAILVFDTSSLSRILGGDEALAKLASSNNFRQRIVPLAADAELRFGFAYGDREEFNLRRYISILVEYEAIIISPDQDTAIKYAELAIWCRKKGVALGNNDLWIAATTIQNGAQLLTLDKDFASLPQLSLIPID